jgi:NADH-quinone oxidoreductase subunit N
MTFLDAVVQSIVGGLGLVVPELVLVLGACVLFVGAAFYRDRQVWGGVALLTLLIAAGCWWLLQPAPPDVASASLLRHTPLTLLIEGAALAAGTVLVLLSWNQISDRLAAEYHACLLLITAGVGLVSSANDLVLLFLALELVSIPTYILLYLPRYDPLSQEAATKYFLLSIFSSGLFLFGVSYVYGLGGSTNLEVLQVSLPALRDSGADMMLGVGLVMALAGLCFRITAAPFHFYAPDVYQGTHPVCAALLAVVPKLAGFTALFLILTTTLGVGAADFWHPLVRQAMTALCWLLALVSMTIGNLLALLQNDLKRLLAYSGVAHAGYLLVGVGAGLAEPQSGGLEAVFFYLLIYAAMTLGAFAVIGYVARGPRPVETVEDLSGLWRSSPVLALLLTLFLFSLTGLPPAAGFWGKLYIFLSAWSTGSTLYRVLAVAMAINAAFGAWYYLRIVAAMYLRQPGRERERPQETPMLIGAAACGLAVLLLFVVPGPFWRAAEVATGTTASTPAPITPAAAKASGLSQR